MGYCTWTDEGCKNGKFKFGMCVGPANRQCCVLKSILCYILYSMKFLVFCLYVQHHFVLGHRAAEFQSTCLHGILFISSVKMDCYSWQLKFGQNVRHRYISFKLWNYNLHIMNFRGRNVLLHNVDNYGLFTSKLMFCIDYLILKNELLTERQIFMVFATKWVHVAQNMFTKSLG